MTSSTKKCVAFSIRLFGTLWKLFKLFFFWNCLVFLWAFVFKFQKQFIRQFLWVTPLTINSVMTPRISSQVTSNISSALFWEFLRWFHWTFPSQFHLQFLWRIFRQFLCKFFQMFFIFNFLLYLSREVFKKLGVNISKVHKCFQKQHFLTKLKKDFNHSYTFYRTIRQICSYFR